MKNITQFIEGIYFQIKAWRQAEFTMAIMQSNIPIFDKYMAHHISFKGWHKPLYYAVREARGGSEAAEYMVNTLLKAGASPNAKSLNALGQALDHFVEYRTPFVIGYEAYIREQKRLQEEPAKSQVARNRDMYFRIITALLQYGAVPNERQAKSIRALREENPYFDKCLLEKDIDNRGKPQEMASDKMPTVKRLRHKI